jgi:hypothetical protein
MFRLHTRRSVLEWETDLSGTGWAHLAREKGRPLFRRESTLVEFGLRPQHHRRRVHVRGRHANNKSIFASIVVISAQFPLLASSYVVPLAHAPYLVLKDSVERLISAKLMLYFIVFPLHKLKFCPRLSLNVSPSFDIIEKRDDPGSLRDGLLVGRRRCWRRIYETRRRCDILMIFQRRLRRRHSRMWDCIAKSNEGVRRSWEKGGRGLRVPPSPTSDFYFSDCLTPTPDFYYFNECLICVHGSLACTEAETWL